MSDKKKTVTAPGKEKEPATGKKERPGLNPFNPPAPPAGSKTIKKTFINMGFMDAMKAIFEEKSEPKE